MPTQTRMFSGRAMLIALAAGLAGLTLALPRADAAVKASPACPSFRVLGNDRIGPAVLPKGNYTVKVVGGLSCAKASALFTRFLEDYDGVLPHRWHVVAKGRGKAAFKHHGRRRFSVARGSGGGGGGGGGHHHSHLGSLCPGSFTVLHNDHIGPLSFPKGKYELFIPRHSVISCGRASKLFTKFLALPNGRLPHGWRLKAQIAVFYRHTSPAHKRFRVDPGT